MVETTYCNYNGWALMDFTLKVPLWAPVNGGSFFQLGWDWMDAPYRTAEKPK